MSVSPHVAERAWRLAEDLVAAGAVFTFMPGTSTMPASFVYELGRGGDRWRCRGIIAEGKADALVWHELVAEVGRRCNGGASD